VVEIRKVNSAIPVFVSSGYADDPVMANPDSFGFTDSICKPFKIDELILLLNRNLGEKR
jgi:DNA-binding NtrC family response regulator